DVHRDIHSLPTRLSSARRQAQRARTRRTGLRTLKRASMLAILYRRNVKPRRLQASGPAQPKPKHGWRIFHAPADGADDANDPAADRKSTRLNSSHVKNSY